MSESPDASPMRPETGSTASPPPQPSIPAPRAARPADRLMAAVDAVLWSARALPACTRRHCRGCRHIVLFFIGAFAMRGAGCTWNDLVDRDLDATGRTHTVAADSSRQVSPRRPTLSCWRRLWWASPSCSQFNRLHDYAAASPRSAWSRSILS